MEKSTESKFGICVGQRILAVDNRPVATVHQLQKAVMSAGLQFELTVASLPMEYMKPQPLMEERKNEDDDKKFSRNNGLSLKGDISQYGILSWGAPAIHSFKFKNGGLAEMARKIYRSEEKRLETIESNRLLRRRLDNASFWFATAERELERLERKRKMMKTPKQIDAEARARENGNKSKRKPKSTMFDFFSNKSYRRTQQDQLKVDRYDQISSEISSKRAEFQAARQKVRNLGNSLNSGIKKASGMYKSREISSLKFTERRDCAVSMALAALVTGFTYRLERAAGNLVELERFVRVGFVAYFENLLSALDSSAPGGAYDKSFTQDMIVAIESLGLVCFQVVEVNDEDVDNEEIEEVASVRYIYMCVCVFEFSLCVCFFSFCEWTHF